MNLSNLSTEALVNVVYSDANYAEYVKRSTTVDADDRKMLFEAMMGLVSCDYSYTFEQEVAVRREFKL